jgi:Spy/CpxP family protein refolding chaperone
MKILRTILIGCLFTALSPAFLGAQAGNGFRLGKWWKNGQIAARLKLSPEQQAKIETLWTQNRQSLIDEKAALDKRNQDLSEILGQNSVDENKAMAAYERMLSARSNIQRTTFLMRVRIKNMLTPEQQRTLEEISPRVRETMRNRKSESPDSALPEP